MTVLTWNHQTTSIKSSILSSGMKFYISVADKLLVLLFSVTQISCYWLDRWGGCTGASYTGGINHAQG